MTNSTGLRPVSAHDRIGLLDALRAVALLGIFLVNIEWFTRPWQEFGSGIAAGAAGADYAVAWMIHVFLAGKFWILFSLLFGMGFALMLERAEAAGRAFGGSYLRRIAVLFAIGIAHALLLWIGDILHTYALAGALLYALRRLPARTQLAVGLSLYLGISLLMLLSGALMRMLPEEAGAEAEAAASTALEAHEAALVYAHGGFAEVTAQRLRDFSAFLPLNIAVVPMALGVFLVGSWLLRSGRIRDAAAHRGFFVRLAMAGVLSGLALSLASAAVGVSFARDDAQGVIAGSLMVLGALPLSLGYLSLLVLAWSAPAGARTLGVLAPAGRMALTHYLLQSLFASLVFYGYGLGMYGRVSHAGLVLLALSLFALQVLASRWWLARFRFGPAEWLWRCATYGRWL